MASRDLDDRLGGKGWIGWTMGALILAPMVVPAVAKVLRPVVKEAIKGFLSLSERAREVMAETSEQMQDLVAEAKAEYEQESARAEIIFEDDLDGGDPDRSDGGEEVAADGAANTASRRPRKRRARAEGTQETG